MNTFEKDGKYVAATYGRFPVEIVGGKGSLAFGSDGKKYIDLTSGIGVNSFGYCDDEWVSAVSGQLNLLQHTSNLYYTAPCADLAEKLCLLTGMKKVFFANSGAEANECAIKAARKYAAEKKGEEYYNIITLRQSFHGRTLTTLAATGQETFHKLFRPLTSGFVHVSAGDADELRAATEKYKTAAIIVECVQGEGGVIPLDSEYLKEVASVAAEKDVLLIVDEVQTGNGRCGKLYSYMNFGICPDIVTTAKGLGGGLPIGACLIGEKAENILGRGDHGSTFGGNPAVCAGALSVINRLTPQFLADVQKKSDSVFAALRGARGITSVTGMGLMIGIKTEKNVADVVSQCIERGVLCLTAKDKLRLLPALNIPQDLLEEAINTVISVCAD